MKREEVLIGNVNRCRPPGNRPPTPEEASMCKPFLLREIAAVQPEVIVVLGNTAMRNLLEIKRGITSVRGQFQDYHGVKVMPTFHPAYLLRDPSKKKETWEDLKKVRAVSRRCKKTRKLKTAAPAPFRFCNSEFRATFHPCKIARNLSAKIRPHLKPVFRRRLAKPLRSSWKWPFRSTFRPPSFTGVPVSLRKFGPTRFAHRRSSWPKICYGLHRRRAGTTSRRTAA